MHKQEKSKLGPGHGNGQSSVPYSQASEACTRKRKHLCQITDLPPTLQPGAPRSPGPSPSHLQQDCLLATKMYVHSRLATPFSMCVVMWEKVEALCGRRSRLECCPFRKGPKEITRPSLCFIVLHVDGARGDPKHKGAEQEVIWEVFLSRGQSRRQVLSSRT